MVGNVVYSTLSGRNAVRSCGSNAGSVDATLSGPADADRLRGDEHRVAFVRIKKPCSVVAEQGFDCIS